VSKKNRAPKAAKIRDVYVPVPFAGLADESEWIALRELVPAATAPLRLHPTLVEKFGEREIMLVTILPMAWPAMVKQDGRIMLGLQRHVQSGDVNRDLAVAVLSALETAPGQPVAVPSLPGEGERLADVLANEPLEITMQETFGFWLDAGQDEDPGVRASLDSANSAITPTVKLAAARAAYWTRMGEKAHVRWVLPDDEESAMDTLSRLHARGELKLGEQTRFAGMFRAHGRLVPVWDLPADDAAESWEGPFEAFTQRYAAVLTESGPLDAEARRAKQGLLSRQLTLR
jgi:hypothetical protein